MSGDPFVRDLGHADGLDGLAVHVGVDYDCVTLTIAGAECRLESAQAEEFAQLFVSACWQAARQVVADSTAGASGGGDHGKVRRLPWICHRCGIQRRHEPCSFCGACKGCCEKWIGAR